ncbi:hypothetical protein AT6N2_C2875 [Agrobacterium tumefaciens]|nr:hypothetical protein AT6N2_C2875 [Agrobacterium tumefaciens]
MNAARKSSIQKPALRHGTRQRAVRPKLVQCAHQVFDIRIAMQRGRGDTQALGLARNGRVVDRLHINTVAIEQDIRNPFALGSIANHDRHDVAGIVHMRNTASVEKPAQLAHAVLMPGPLERARLQVLDRSNRAGGERRRQCRREDETGSEGADEIADRGGAGNVPAHDAEGLAERSLDDRQAIHQAFALGNAAAARAVHAHSVDFVEIGHGAITIGEIADFPDRRDIAVHGVNGFESDQLRRVRISGLELGLEVLQIIVLPDHPLTTAIPDALDHRGMVERVRKDDQARYLLAERAEGGPVRNITRGEDQRRFLAMEVSKLALQQDVIVVGARNIPGASRTRATVINGGFHGFDDFRVLAHAEVVVGAPDGNVLPLTIGVVACRAGKVALLPLYIRKNAITSLRMQALQFRREKCLEVHAMLQN